MKVFLYCVIPGLTILLCFLGKDIELPKGMQEKGVSRLLLKASIFIYQNIYLRLFRKRQMTWENDVRANLSMLSHKKNIEELETAYYIRKISLLLVMLLSGSFLSMMVYFSSENEKVLDQSGRIARNESGGGDQSLLVEARNDDGEVLGEFAIDISEQMYTKDEANALFEEASKEVEIKVFENNESPDHVTRKLNLVKKLDGYPFSISWELDNYSAVSYDGEIRESEIGTDGELVTLTATYSYDENTWQQVLYANVYPKSLSDVELRIAQIKELIKIADESTRYEKSMTLPEEYEGSKIGWSEKKEDNSLFIMILMLIGGAAAFVMKDKELKKAVDDRNNQMLLEYPQFVSKLVLYMGAGMTVRSVFEKLSKDYLTRRKEGAPENFMYEELSRSVRELSGGMSETKVYESFGKRCGSQQYTRLSTLLSQNLRKGNSELLGLLKEESDKAFEARLDKARKAGEEAGTKLLLPMIIMLLIVMIIIMIPAYMTF